MPFLVAPDDVEAATRALLGAIDVDEFYRRNGITVPGADTHTPAHYVSHDMNHVISGYEPTGPGEIALGRSRWR